MWNCFGYHWFGGTGIKKTWKAISSSFFFYSTTKAFFFGGRYLSGEEEETWPWKATKKWRNKKRVLSSFKPKVVKNVFGTVFFVHRLRKGFKNKRFFAGRFWLLFLASYFWGHWLPRFCLAEKKPKNRQFAKRKSRIHFLGGNKSTTCAKYDSQVRSLSRVQEVRYRPLSELFSLFSFFLPIVLAQKRLSPSSPFSAHRIRRSQVASFPSSSKSDFHEYFSRKSVSDEDDDDKRMRIRVPLVIGFPSSWWLDLLRYTFSFFFSTFLRGNKGAKRAGKHR